MNVRGRNTREVEDIMVLFRDDYNAANFIKQSKSLTLKFADKRVNHIFHKVEFDINQCIGQLVMDPTSRRARIIEADYHPYNIACIQSVQFLIRDGKLKAKLFLRSSDLSGVLPYDVYATHQLQHHVMVEVNKRSKHLAPLEMGSMTAFISSGHVYV